MNKIVYRFGVPRVIVSDQAKEIPGLQNHLMKTLGIHALRQVHILLDLMVK